MVKRTPPKPPRKRVRVVNLDTRSLQGPYYVEGDLGKETRPRGGGAATSKIREKVWFDTRTGFFVLEDGRIAFDAMPTPSPPVLESARSKERKQVTQVLAETQRQLNAAERDVERARDAPARREAQAEVKALQAQRDDTRAVLDTLKTSTQKVEERAGKAVDRKVPSAGLKQGTLNILSEYDKQTNEVRLFFAGSRPGEEHRRDCDPGVRACRLVLPAVKSALEHFIEPGERNDGERGFWAVSAWDYPKVVQELTEIPGVRLMGAPELDLSKKFKGLDQRAAAIDSRNIEFGEMPPRVGETQSGKKIAFQEEGIKFLMSRNHAVLADDMGLGKTYQAIIAAQNAVPKNQQILVICPAAVVGSWLKDISVFMPSAAAIGFDTSYVTKEGMPSKRPEKVRFVICSYQGASSQQGEAKVSKMLLAQKWGLVILDEAHRLKKSTTLLHKYVAALRTDKMWFLTGTPISNRVIDYYGLLALAQHPAGKRLDEFKRNFVPSVVKAGKTEVATDRAPLIALGEGLTGFVLRRTKEEVLSRDLPKKVGGIATNDGFIEANLPRAFAEELQRASDQGAPRERLRHALAVAKTPSTWEVAQRVIGAGDKVVLFSTYTDVLHGFAELCEEAGLLYIVISGSVPTEGKSAMVKLFQGDALTKSEEKWAKNTLGQWWLNLVRYVPTSDWTKEDLAACRAKFGANDAKWPHEIQVVLAQMVAASEGVTLTKADTLLFNDFDYMPSRHQQAEDRIYRLTKSGKMTHPAVFIGYIFANDPLDLDRSTLTSLRAKKAEIDDVYESVGDDIDGAAKRIRNDYLRELKTIGTARNTAQQRDAESRKAAARGRTRGKRRNPFSRSTMGW